VKKMPIFSMLPELSTASLFLKAPQWTISIIYWRWNVFTGAWAMSEKSSSKQQLAAAALQRGRFLRVECEVVSWFQIHLYDLASAY
jgi:hypothetical protein